VAGYHLSEDAHADLVGIALYIVERGATGRKRLYIGRLYEGFAALAEDPALGRACDDVRACLRRVQEVASVGGGAPVAASALRRSASPADRLERF
jgi:plasmid stabilization system protein ParE